MKKSMKTNDLIILCIIFLFPCVVLTCCYKVDYTRFYEDAQAPGLSIFSDKADNLMTCYAGNEPWKTYDRINNSYEVNIERFITSDTADLLMINWYGEGGDYNFTFTGEISFVLLITKNFVIKILITCRVNV